MGLLLRFEGGEMLRGYDVFYTILPLYNIDGFASTFGTLFDGGQVLLRNGFSASSFWTDVEAHDAEITSVVPSILAILLEVGEPEDTDVSSFKVFMVSGSYVPEELLEAFESTFGMEVMEIYGLTEAAGTSYGDPTEMVSGSAGTAVEFAELSVVDEESREEMAPGKIGEIRIRGPTVFKQYYRNPEATMEVFEGNWFKTGDLGYIDEDGRYHILDRIKNIIIRGGQNIYPGEIEETIHTLESVEDVAVVGEDHNIYGEVPIAYITTGPDADPDVVIEEVEAVCAENLAEFKQPEEVRTLDEFPRGETGKVLKTDL
jgi:acyl-CoA synthetase (AMP-forming)/AMP-acid ligase II